jgi:hypothetical protein
MPMPKGSHPSEETRRKMSEAHKNPSEETRWKNGSGKRGKLVPEEIRRKISEHEKGKIVSKETGAKISAAKKGKITRTGFHHTEETKKILAELARGNTNRRGKHHTDEAKKILAEKSKGNKNWLGLKQSEETRIKLIEAKGRGIWYGAVKYDENLYCEKFNEDLKERVRAFWGYVCFECGTPQNGQRLHVHHVHYNRRTCCDGSPHDMVPLCVSCHGKTNKDRDYWEDHFTESLYAYSPDGKCFFTKEEMAAL